MKAKRRCDSPQGFCKQHQAQPDEEREATAVSHRCQSGQKQGNLMKHGGNSQAELTDLTKCS